MGLYEKRILAKYKTQCQNEIFPKLKQLGDLNLTIEVSWDNIYKEFNTRDASSDRFTIEDLDRYMNYAFYSPVTVALESICSDAMGRDLIKKSLKSLEFKTDGTNKGSVECFNYSSGKLVINQSMALDDRQSNMMAESLQKLLEKDL